MSKRLTEEEVLFRNPLGKAVLKNQIIKDVKKLKTDSEIQAFMGGNHEAIAKNAGVLLYSMSVAIKAQRYPYDSDVSILRGMAEALESIMESPVQLENQRQSIISGLAAMERIIPKLSTWAIGFGMVKCKEKIADRGFGAADIHALLKPDATIGKPVAA